MALLKMHQPKREAYKTRAPLADELLDLTAELSRLTMSAGALSERLRRMETQRNGAPAVNGSAASPD